MLRPLKQVLPGIPSEGQGFQKNPIELFHLIWHWQIRGGNAGIQQDQFLSFLHTFSPKKCMRRSWRPPPQRVGAPPHGKSWIRHCLDNYFVFTKWCILVFITCNLKILCAKLFINSYLRIIEVFGNKFSWQAN